ncbi:hypothetical protein COCON_G00024430 [Conger conger]|uniref:Cytochrome P450 n=1 Tax=Conger conger TaxID=82655 RepID=A0A9Q1DXJ9_CONCO|nr:hypothetical protein COCON_G00024430 [Conger conger]
MLEGILPQMPPPLTLLGVVVVLFLFYLLSSTPGTGKHPPGPRPLPLFGNLFHLDLKRLHVSLCELSKKYGSVFTLHLGPKKVVVLAGCKTIKQALVNYAEDFGDREIAPIFRESLQGHGVLFTNGNSWKEMRRFSLTNLRDFGMGKRGSEEKIIEECRQLTEVFKNFKVLQDEEEWETPHSFNPGHFLDEKGCFIKRDAFMPFSAGRRACLGESLARMELFLFFTFLLQRFRFTPPPGVSEDELDLTPSVGLTLSPSPHQLCAVSRA